jgi:hypothetical protein
MKYINCKVCKNREPDCGDITEPIIDCQLWEPKRKGYKRLIEVK